MIKMENDVLSVEIAEHGAEPVSYTHLDVYKRQLKNNGRESCIF